MTSPNIEQFLALPVNPGEIFQGGTAGMSELLGVEYVEGEDELALVLWCSVTTGVVHAEPLPSELRNNADAFIGVLLRLCSEGEFPDRPGRIECNDQAMTKKLRKLLAESGTEVSFLEQMPEWEHVVRISFITSCRR